MQIQKRMNTAWLLTGTKVLLSTVMLTHFSAGSVLAAGAEYNHAQATQALSKLYKSTPGAKALADKAKAVLIFSNIVKSSPVRVTSSLTQKEHLP